MREMITYLTFNGNARQAMEFYKECLGGELFMMPFSEAPGDFPKEAKDRIMHATLRNGAVALMASDAMPGMPFQQGTNFSISVIPESVEEEEKLFTAVAKNGKITMPLQDTFWGAHFGMVTDQFGIQWMFNLEKGKDG